MKTLINNLENNLENKLDWRFKELYDIGMELNKLKTDDKEISKKSFLVRGSVALIYAHWEGSVKDIFLEYIEFINSNLKSNSFDLSKNTIFVLNLLLYKYRENKSFQKIICDISVFNKLLKTEIIDLEIYKINIENYLEAYKKAKSKSLNNDEIIQDFLHNKTEKLRILSNNLNTESNLGFDVLIDIFHKFDIEMTIDIEIEKFRIKQLVDNRNDIAHGDDNFFNENSNDKLNKNIDTIYTTLDKIVELIKLIKLKVEEKSELF